jgi:hypothetical protein
MSQHFCRINYKDLTTPQQESYNYQKASGILADFGFTTIRLSDDWQGADFIAQHCDGVTFLKVQLKGRLTLAKKYIGRDIHVCFPSGDTWYLFPHDEILNIIIDTKNIEESTSWMASGEYHYPSLSKEIKVLLEPYKLESMEKSQIKISDLFNPEPNQWGFRGDPLLWREMSSALSETPLPRSLDLLISKIEDTFVALTNHQLSSCEPIHIKRYDEGGMSSGQISSEFWRKIAIPLLISRMEDMKSS